MSDLSVEPPDQAERDRPPVLRRRREPFDLRVAVRRHLVPVAVATALALLVGILVGRVTATPDGPPGVDVVASSVAPLVVDADAIWTTADPERLGVAAGLLQLRRADDPTAVQAHGARWIEEYDTVLRRLVGVEVPPEARPVQRQFVNAVTLSRDAVEVLLSAAVAPDPAARRELSSEVVRLRTRAEHLHQSARASLADLIGSGSAVSIPRELPRLADLRGRNGGG